MLIKQISVFIENMPGKLGEVTQVLGENGIDMSALSLADKTKRKCICLRFYND